MTLPMPNPIDVRRKLDAALAAGAAPNVLAMNTATQVLQLIMRMIDGSPLPMKCDDPIQSIASADPDATEDYWTLTVRWPRPTVDEMMRTSAAVKQESPNGRLPVAFGGDAEVIR